MRSNHSKCRSRAGSKPLFHDEVEGTKLDLLNSLKFSSRSSCRTLRNNFFFPRSPPFVRGKMHSVSSRLMAIVTSAMYTIAVCAIGMAIQSAVSDYVYPPQPALTLSARQMTPIYRAHLGWDEKNSRVVHRTTLQINMTADFSQCFNWNTKVLYVYVVAEYANKVFKRNELILYDRIIETKSASSFSVLNEAEYPLDDIAERLAGTEIAIKIRYQTMQYSGYAPIREVSGAVFRLRLSDAAVTQELYSQL